MHRISQGGAKAGHQHVGDITEVRGRVAQYLLPVGAHAPQNNRQRIANRNDDRRDNNAFGKILFRLLGFIHQTANRFDSAVGKDGKNHER